MELLEGITYLGLDTETFLIAPQDLAPKFVCVSTCYWDPVAGVFETELLGNGDEGVEGAIRSILEDKTIHIVGASISYDMTVFARNFPALIPLIFAAYEQERVHCTVAREKTLNLSDTGDLANLILPNGKPEKVNYKLSSLERRYLGIDRSAEKEGDDIWRLNFASLDGKKASEYPEEAAKYAKDDALGCLRVFYEQQNRQVSVQGHCSLNTSEFQAASDFALRLITCRGMAIDAGEKAKIDEMLAEASKPEKLGLLISSGILRPPVPPRPYKKGSPIAKMTFDFDGMDIAKRRDLFVSCWAEIGKPEKVEITASGKVVASVSAAKRIYKEVTESPVETRGANCIAFLTYGVIEEENEIRMTKGEKESIDTKKLAALVAQMRLKEGLDIVYSNPEEADESKLNVSCKAEVLEPITHLSPVLQQYQDRQKLRKLVTTEIPRMCLEDGSTAPVVHFCFDVLKETTRTSSYAGGSSQSSYLYPSANGQNIDPRVRPCYKPRDGYLLCSIDYSSIELVSAAQRQLSLFGHSKLATLLAAEVDLHGYLAAQMAYRLSNEFRASYDSQGGDCSEMSIYEVFNSCKSDPREEVRAFHKHWRTFAKPVGLGFPGGLGAGTFVGFAKAQYGIVLDLEMAKTLKRIWLDTFSEYKQGFDWISNQCMDQKHPVLGYSKTGTPVKGYAYTTPMGAYRAACAYTSACNGSFLQSPTAEGAKLAVFDCVNACYNPEKGSLAQGCFPVDFIHDEILFEVPIDGKEHERAMALAEIMVDSMRLLFPDVPVKAEPALMERWYKHADPVYDAQGRLAVWKPSH